MDEPSNALSTATAPQSPTNIAVPPAGTKSATSLVLGILSLIFWLIPFFGLPIAIVGLVFGVRRHYTTGIVLNVIGLALAVANAAVGAYMGYLRATGKA